MADRDVRWFIDKIFLDEYDRILNKHGFHYLSFTLMASGIEFLGAVLDEHPYDMEKESSNRFRLAIGELFPAQYKNFNKPSGAYYLYNHLRNALVHHLRPGSRIELTHQEESDREHTQHLQISSSGRLTLIAEVLYNDFRDACRELLKRIDEGKLDPGKVCKKFIST